MAEDQFQDGRVAEQSLAKPPKMPGVPGVPGIPGLPGAGAGVGCVAAVFLSALGAVLLLAGMAALVTWWKEVEGPWQAAAPLLMAAYPIVPYLALVLICYSRGMQGRGAWAWGARLFLGSMMFCCLATMLGAAGMFVVPAFPMVGVFGAVVLWRMGQFQRLDLLERLHQTVALNLPWSALPGRPTRWAGGMMGDGQARVVERLRAGMMLGPALRGLVPPLARADLSLLEAGERTGRLSAVLARLVTRQRDRLRGYAQMGVVFGYGFWLIMMVFLVAVFVLWAMGSRLTRVFAELEGVPPWPARLLFAAAQFLHGDPDAPPLGLLLGLMGPPLALLLGWAATRIGPGRLALDWVWWQLPVTHSLARDRGLGDACHVVGEALEAGMPPHRALAEAAELRVNWCLRCRLRRWADLAESGQTPGAAARGAGLPALVAGSIATAEAGGNLREAMEFLRGFYDSRYVRLTALLRGVGLPVATAVAALVVGLIALGIMTALVQAAFNLMPAEMVIPV